MMGVPDRADLTAPTTLVIELLTWLTLRPRSYRETMEAWRTSCPRMPVWEDALQNALVAVAPDEGCELVVTLTEKGRDFLDHVR
jgi:hypothetical protein